ncbi:PD-(D/E)XK nuclease family protein [Salinarchaeum laminariae]|uniref:PD-(D/E)XK nuclease family protein n=1 Tax=Salinarchaeum laminariae TaxID=869888 RepID=UPI0020BDA69B|nr:PD-(D/E)XK nuclease family protein [Salinarchaeum laminariae]
MHIEEGPAIEAVGEREIDFTVAQLLSTSPQFRRWFVEQVVPDAHFGEFIGVITHAHYAGEGESDIEFGFLTQAGDRHVVLIENKINAAKQPDQIERYYNRGEIRVERHEWDSFSVCLLAPEGYVSKADETGVDSVIHYEAVQAQLVELSHDGAPFFQDIFETAMRKSSTVDASATIASIENRVHAQTGLPLTTAFTGRKRVSFQSSHPDHPDAVWYDAFIGKTGESGRTTVRLHIESIEELTEERRNALKSTISRHTEAIPGYECHFHRKVNIVSTTIWHEDALQDPGFEDHIEAIVDELIHLSTTIHPILVEEDIA